MKCKYCNKTIRTTETLPILAVTGTVPLEIFTLELHGGCFIGIVIQGITEQALREKYGRVD